MSNDNQGLLGPQVSYVELLDDHTIKRSSEQGAGDYYPLRPSAAGKCTRELGYDLAEHNGLLPYTAEERSPETSRLLDLGHSVEYHILQQFKGLEAFEVRYKQQVVSFFKVDADRWIEGSIDAVFWSKEHKAVIDFKSKKDKFSSWSSSNWSETDEKLSKMASVERKTDKLFWVPDLELFLRELRDPFLAANFWQLNLYANSSFIKERGINHASIIQYNKNDSRMREIRFVPSETVYKQLVDKYTAVQEAVVQKQDPELLPKDYALGSIKCAFCKHKRRCWGEDTDALKAYFATWPQKQWPRDTSHMTTGATLEELFVEYENGLNIDEQQKYIEQSITRLMEAEKVTKIRLANKNIYEMKALKTGLVIRRAKL